MSSKRREYHVDRRSKKAALFFVACDANPDTRVKIPDAMRIKGYSQSEAADRSLQMQVRREADKIKGEAIPGPPAPAAAAASALLTLLTTANVGRPALRITTVPAAVSVVGGTDASILPSPERIFVTGGEHVTSNDMLIATELNQRKAEATGREKVK
jgi:hypothetical protein